MLNQPEPACLVIADISGYTGYLAGVELDHAQDILADLIGDGRQRPPPDVPPGEARGRRRVRLRPQPSARRLAAPGHVERCYFAFRRRLRDIRQASSCECNACILIPSLDLKFVVHHGPVVRQQMAGREELVGRDVIVVHRLLKNHVVQDTGFAAYALYTEACIEAMGIADRPRPACASTARPTTASARSSAGRVICTPPGRPSRPDRV